MGFALIIPTFNAGREIPLLFSAIARQTLQPDSILVIDSSSTDETVALLKKLPVTIHSIPQHDFDHGGTRQLGAQLVEADVYLFMTQDAIPVHSDCFERLIHSLLSEDRIGCAYGRQLPHANADPLAAHARLFNYPPHSRIVAYVDKDQWGVKTFFNSNSFSAYKKSALKQVGGFPSKLMVGEDCYVAANLLRQGYAISYVADACVYHSHNLTVSQEFHRYFSIGVFHRNARDLIKAFGSANGEGRRFVLSEITYLIKHHKISWIPRACLSIAVKFLAYKMGLCEKRIPYCIKKNWSVNRSFWLK